MFISSIALAQSTAKSKFYDFGEQVIDGEIKTPTALWIDEVQRAKFDRLLKLKRSFLRDLEETAKDPLFK